ncbi:MAG: class I SAM-dependent methyltransferase [Maritimibacter harenae]|jgi:SAM-dependent methyltransferase
MPDLLRAQDTLGKRVFGFAFHLFDLVAYDVLYRLSPARRMWFFNGGYLPVDPDFVSHPEFAGEDHSAMMYHQAGHTMVKDQAPAPRRILDVGCGQGGGMVYLSRLYPEADMTGTERSAAAVRLAKRRTKGLIEATITRGHSGGLAFGDESFDMVVSVGAPTYFGLTLFIEEAGRVVTPGGLISFSGGYRQGDHAKVEAEIREAAAREGLEVLAYRDITPHTFASLKADIPRREAALKRVPWPFSLYAYRWADMPGSPEYEEYEHGLRADFAAVLRKPS